MPRIRRNNGVPLSAPREGRGELVKPEVVHGGHGTQTPTGTREHDGKTPLRYEAIKNGLPRFVPYDPSPEAREWRRKTYRLAQQARARAEAKYGPRPTTIRGLVPPRKRRKRKAAAAATEKGADHAAA